MWFLYIAIALIVIRILTKSRPNRRRGVPPRVAPTPIQQPAPATGATRPRPTTWWGWVKEILWHGPIEFFEKFPDKNPHIWATLKSIGNAFKKGAFYIVAWVLALCTLNYLLPEAWNWYWNHQAIFWLSQCFIIAIAIFGNTIFGKDNLGAKIVFVVLLALLVLGIIRTVLTEGKASEKISAAVDQVKSVVPTGSTTANTTTTQTTSGGVQQKETTVTTSTTTTSSPSAIQTAKGKAIDALNSLTTNPNNPVDLSVQTKGQRLLSHLMTVDKWIVYGILIAIGLIVLRLIFSGKSGTQLKDTIVGFVQVIGVIFIVLVIVVIFAEWLEQPATVKADTQDTREQTYNSLWRHNNKQREETLTATFNQIIPGPKFNSTTETCYWDKKIDSKILKVITASGKTYIDDEYGTLWELPISGVPADETLTPLDERKSIFSDPQGVEWRKIGGFTAKRAPYAERTDQLRFMAFTPGDEVEVKVTVK